MGNIIKKSEDLSQFGSGGDVSSLSITVYANFVTYGGKEQSLFETNARTFVYIKSVEVIEALVSQQQYELSLDVDNSASDGSKLKLRNTASLAIFSTQNTSHLFKKDAVLFTISKPIDAHEYINDNQDIYVSSITLPGEVNDFLGDPDMDPGLVTKLDQLSNNKNITKYNLVNIKEINTLQNSSIILTTTPRINHPTKLTLIYDRSFCMHKVFVKGQVDNEYQDINVKYAGTTLFGLIKLTPISILNKLILKSDSLDNNLTLPYNYLKTWTGATKGLRSAIVTTNSAYKTDLWQVFLSMLELTRAFSNGFADYQIKGNDGRSGIDPDAKIGGIKIGLLSGTNQSDAVTAISGRIEDWKLKHPKYVDSDEFKVFKVFVNMLSPYIQCNLALGGGLNQNNKIEQLFYFDLRASINKGLADSPSTPILVQLKSSFYDINATTQVLTIKEQFKILSQYQVLDIDGSISFAELEEEIQAVTLAAKPGDRNPLSENISKYYFYIPVDDQNSLLNLYGKKGTPGSSSSRTVTRQGVGYVQVGNGTTQTFVRQGVKPTPTPPPKNSTTPLVKAPEIYSKFINLPNNQRMNFINGVPDVKNIKIVYHETLIKSYQKSNCQASFGSIYTCDYTIQYEDSYFITFDYVVKIDLSISPVVSFDPISSIYDKQGFLNLVKETFSPNQIKIELDFNYFNPNTTINDISQVVMSGLFGNTFSLEMRGSEETIILAEYTKEKLEILGIQDNDGDNIVFLNISEFLGVGQYKNLRIDAVIPNTVTLALKEIGSLYPIESQDHLQYVVAVINDRSVQDGDTITLSFKLLYEQVSILTSGNLDFSSKYNEVQTKTKINF